MDLETHSVYISNFVLIFLRDFTAIDSPLTLASRQQPRYSTIRYSFNLLLLHVMLISGKFLSLLKRMHFDLYLPKWTDSLLSTNQSYAFQNSLSKTFSISVTSLCWQKILVSSAYRYVWVFDKACRISFLYSINNKGPNIDPWGTPPLMFPPSDSA